MEKSLHSLIKNNIKALFENFQKTPFPASTSEVLEEWIFDNLLLLDAEFSGDISKIIKGIEKDNVASKVQCYIDDINNLITDLDKLYKSNTEIINEKDYSDCRKYLELILALAYTVTI